VHIDFHEVESSDEVTTESCSTLKTRLRVCRSRPQNKTLTLVKPSRKYSKTSKLATKTQLHASPSGRRKKDSSEDCVRELSMPGIGGVASKEEPVVTSELSTDTVTFPPILPKKKKSKNKHYLCSECGNTLKSKSAMEIHMRRHTDSRPFVCQICGHGFRANGNLMRHQVITHVTRSPYSILIGMMLATGHR